MSPLTAFQVNEEETGEVKITKHKKYHVGLDYGFNGEKKTTITVFKRYCLKSVPMQRFL